MNVIAGYRHGARLNDIVKLSAPPQIDHFFYKNLLLTSISSIPFSH
jgi:hypothetical protein